MAGFATDATHVSSSGTALAQTGIKNAFANATNLETLGTGEALATTPAGNGTVPQAEINTLANILAPCVSSTGSCTALLSAATADGTVTGAKPTDTATAAINIAHHPGANVGALYGIAPPNPPFAPALTAAPHDWTVALVFSGSSIESPDGLAVDGAGDVWIASPGTSQDYQTNCNITELSSLGTVLSGTGGFVRGSVRSPSGIAIENSGNVWISGQVTHTYEISDTGAFVGGTYGYGGSGSATAVAVDATGNVWFAEADYLQEFSDTGAALPGGDHFGNGLNTSFGLTVAIDGSGSAWVSNFTGTVTVVTSSGGYPSGANGYLCCGGTGGAGTAIDSLGDAWVVADSGVIELSNTGALLSPQYGFQQQPIAVSLRGLAIDGAGMVWVLSGTGISELSNTGAPLSGTNGYTTALAIGNLSAIAIDGSGDVWVTNAGDLVSPSSGGIVEFVGAATPVITPIVAGLPATPTADGSNMLGTRP
jgi:hypothetical protein